MALVSGEDSLHGLSPPPAAPGKKQCHRFTKCQNSQIFIISSERIVEQLLFNFQVINSYAVTFSLAGTHNRAPSVHFSKPKPSLSKMQLYGLITLLPLLLATSTVVSMNACCMDEDNIIKMPKTWECKKILKCGHSCESNIKMQYRSCNKCSFLFVDVSKKPSCNRIQKYNTPHSDLKCHRPECAND
ncbi:hypothetical protein PCANC_19404 [Puccinia coronata f. sp. avenae]|uniref:Uncharacterized protein n=1 Tax=Puccinia coronata f. sp. avenae TaxID=200324 RepID=A0A2N5SKS4_9BASI|nr:hypothetical protein PCANC_19404 [Puccinia coronata f. sp. avenae]PLW17282.1 hypothetical protein PCASD_18362 [Puccinia coronata f. sp. avenae]